MQKSRTLKIRNIPMSLVLYRMRIKPTSFLLCMFGVGIGLVFLSEPYTTFGLLLCTTVAFALIAMPDRTLLDINLDYLMFYDPKEPDTCTILYWDEIVSWQYQKQRSCDHLVVELIDNSVHSCEVYRSSRLIKLLNQFAPGKEKRVQRRWSTNG